MRKATRFFRFLSIALLTAAVAACSDSDNDNPTTPPGGDGGSGGGSEVVPTEGVTTEAFYKGDLYGTGSGNLWINFISEMEYDDFEEDYIGPGYILCLDFNTTLAQNADFATLAEGTYTCDYASDSHETFTLNVALGDSYLVRYAEGGGSESFDITGGTVTVAIREDYYCIDAALTLSDNSEYSYSFVGKLSFLNRSNEGQMSNLTDDVALSGMTQAMAAYYGASFTDTSDFYTVIIAGPDYDLDINYGTSDALMLTLNVTPRLSGRHSVGQLHGRRHLDGRRLLPEHRAERHLRPHLRRLLRHVVLLDDGQTRSFAARRQGGGDQQRRRHLPL